MPRQKLELAPQGPKATGKSPLKPGMAGIAVGAIGQRPDGDTRPLTAAHVVTLAESIAALGVLEPVVVDTKWRLLAGGHRLAALHLLAIADPALRRQIFLDRLGDLGKPRGGTNDAAGDTETPAGEDGRAAAGNQSAEPALLVSVGPLADRVFKLDHAAFAARYPGTKIPVVVVDTSGRDAATVALTIETAENAVRRQYTTAEIQALAKRLHAAGFVYDTSGGRPAGGQRTVRGALRAVVGLSDRQLRRILGKAVEGKSSWDKAVGALQRAAGRVVDFQAADLDGYEQAIIVAAEHAREAIEAARSESE